MLNLRCVDCGFNYTLPSVNDTSTLLGKNYYDVAWFSCPACGKVYVVGIKDKKYYDLKAALDNAKRQIRLSFASGNEELSETLRVSVEDKAARLSRHMDLTMEKFHGTFTVRSSEGDKPELVYLP